VQYFAGLKCEISNLAQVKWKSQDFRAMESTHSSSGESHSLQDYFTLRSSISSAHQGGLRWGDVLWTSPQFPGVFLSIPEKSTGKDKLRLTKIGFETTISI
jgi:hypothetical protein